MAKSEGKKNALAGFAESLTLFDPSVKDVFRCPACLTDFPVSNVSDVTVAHIIPQAAGGKLSTWLCKTCNNTFGAQQDRWLGEHARLRTMDSASILDTKIKNPTFRIGDLDLAGIVEEGPDGGLNAYIHSTRNSPEKLKRLEEEIRKYRLTGESSITLTIPLLAKKFEVGVGYLTSAYLLWFRHLGYSFALQSHLDPIREQIANPSVEVIPRTYEGLVSEPFSEPWVSMGYLQGHPVLAAGIVDRVVILPSANRPKVLELLDPDFTQHLLQDLLPVPVLVNAAPVGPLGIFLDKEVFVHPDAMRRNHNAGRFLLLTRDGKKPRYLYPVPPEEFERQRQLPHDYVKTNPPE
jgi:hypothetical protein